MKYYLITDNDNPSRTTIIHTLAESRALEMGACELKTTNIRIKLLNAHQHTCQKCRAINIYEK